MKRVLVGLREGAVSVSVIVAGVALLYLLFAKAGLALAIQAAQVTAVWPATGFAVAAVLLFGRWASLGVFIGAFSANVTTQEPVFVAAGIAAGNTAEAMLGAFILSRFGFDERLSRIRDALLLMVAVAISPIVSATAGVSCLVAGGVQPLESFGSLWGVWWVGDSLGGLIVAPLILVWRSKDRLRWRRGSWAEGGLILILLTLLMLASFELQPNASTIEYAVFPFLIWAALRFGPAGAITVVTVADAIAVWITHVGAGPFAGLGPEEGLVHLQIFMAVAATTGLLFGASIAQNLEADRRKDEFLAMLGHELRNPLAPIAHAGLLLQDDDPRVAGRAKEIIARQTAHLARLVDDLLDVSRISHGTMHLDRRRTRVSEIVDAAVETWRHRIEEHRQDLSVRLPDDTVWLDADPTRLTQVIGNLLHNASKFTPDGGQIGIDVKRFDQDVEITVRDSGEGINRDLLATVFDLFVQGELGIDRARGGLGIGLTLVRRLIDLHDGTIEARSAGPHEGSEFIIRLPAADPPEEDRAVPLPRPIRSVSRRILIVEDHADSRDVMAILMRRAGHQVKTASDGPEALEIAKRFRPEITLLDIGLPGMSGYEVARALRSSPPDERTLLVAITGYGQQEDRMRALEAGFDHHLLKPVEPRALLELIRSVD